MKTKYAHSFMTLAILTACSALAGCSLNFNMVDGYVFTNTGETAEFTEEGKFSEGINAIEVFNRFGNVKVELAEGEPGWKWDSKVWADSQELADQLIDELAMEVQTTGQTQVWKVVLPEPTSDLNGVQSNLTLMVPADVKAKLENTHGNVSVAKLTTGVDLKNGHGNVVLSELSGILKIKNSHGNVTGNQIGPATVDVSHGNADIASATGAVSIKNSHGNVKAIMIGGELSIDGSHSDVEIDQVDSHGDFKTSHGDIVATNLGGDVKTDNSHGSTKIRTLGENVFIRSSHGQVELSMESGSFKSIDIETSYDPLKVDLPAGVEPDIDMKTSHGDAKSAIGSADGSPQKIKLRNSHGDIRITKSDVVAETAQ